MQQRRLSLNGAVVRVWQVFLHDEGLCLHPGTLLEQCLVFLHTILSAVHQLAGRFQEVGDKLTFVIVRPGGLKSEAPTGTGVLTGD